MSSVEDTIERLNKQEGVEGYVICDNEGKVLRHSSMTEEEANTYSQAVKPLFETAQNAARDIQPRDTFKNVRVKSQERELIVAMEQDCVIIVVQSWVPFVPK